MSFPPPLFSFIIHNSSFITSPHSLSFRPAAQEGGEEALDLVLVFARCAVDEVGEGEQFRDLVGALGELLEGQASRSGPQAPPGEAFHARLGAEDAHVVPTGLRQALDEAAFFPVAGQEDARHQIELAAKILRRLAQRGAQLGAGFGRQTVLEGVEARPGITLRGAAPGKRPLDVAPAGFAAAAGAAIDAVARGGARQFQIGAAGGQSLVARAARALSLARPSGENR